MTVGPRVGLLIVALAVAAATGCAPGLGPDARATGTAAVADPTAPSITPNPSLPPIGGLIATGIMLDTRELLIWFGKSEPEPAALGWTWYDRKSGSVSQRPDETTLVWCPVGHVRDLNEVPLGDGRVLDLGLLNGHPDQVAIAQGGREYRASLRAWTQNADVVAFWLVRPRDGALASPGPDVVRFRLTATARGERVADLPVTPCPMVPKGG